MPARMRKKKAARKGVQLNNPNTRKLLKKAHEAEFGPPKKKKKR